MESPPGSRVPGCSEGLPRNLGGAVASDKDRYRQARETKFGEKGYGESEHLMVPAKPGSRPKEPGGGKRMPLVEPVGRILNYLTRAVTEFVRAWKAERLRDPIETVALYPPPV